MLAPLLQRQPDVSWLPTCPQRGLEPLPQPARGQQFVAQAQALEQLPIPGLLAWKATHPDAPAARARASAALDAFLFEPTTVPVAAIAPLDSWAPEFSDRPAAAARVSVVADRTTAPPQALAQLVVPYPDAWLARYPDVPAAPALRGQPPWFVWNTLTPGAVVVPPLDAWAPEFNDRGLAWIRPWPVDLAWAPGLPAIAPPPLSWSPIFPWRPAPDRRLAQAASSVLIVQDTALLAWRPSYPILSRQEAILARLGPYLALPPFVQAAPTVPPLSWLALFPPGSRAAVEQNRADFPWVSFEAFLTLATAFPGIVIGAVNVTLFVGPFGAVLLVPASAAATAGAHAAAALSSGAGQGAPSLVVASPARTSSGPAPSSPTVVVGGPGGKVGSSTPDGQSAGARGSGAAGSGDEAGTPGSSGTKGSNPKVT